uniref:Type 3 secretion system secretin n=1 Tax=Nitratidesulfovibrio vulgaris (strain DSM 19637 / Miyazaki F) TaxID=883 RepID=B8DMS7_NITV9
MRDALPTLALLLCLLVAVTPCMAAPAASPVSGVSGVSGGSGGFVGAYTHYSEQEDLTVLLMDFARSQGLGASFSPGVTGTVSGRFDAVPPEKFLQGMRAAFGVLWYRVGATLNFYSEAETSRIFISPRVMSAEALYQALKQSSVLSPQLPADLMPGGGMIVVAGPQGYLDQVSAAVSAFEEAQTSNFGMRVFPLKYAWAEDISVNSMDKTVTLPGVASILRAMVTGSPASASRVTQEPATVDKLSGTGLVAQGRQQAQPQQSQAPQGQQGAQQPAQARGQQVSIMADPRVNAVIVHDAVYRMPYYESVIGDLDKPVELVEIHAAIVDIDSDYKRDLGVTYQGTAGSGQRWAGGGDFSTGTDAFPTLPSPGKPLGNGLTLSTIYTMGSDYFLAQVTALEKNGEARMLGRPSVLTVDNVQATLENTSTYYIEVQGYQAVDLFKVEAGTVLRVTPHIIRNEDGGQSIKLVVSVQDDQNDNSSATSTSNSTAIPPVKQTKINTQAIVGGGQSLLIGGYYYEQKSTTDTGIPILMDIPVLGHLFKTNSKTSKRMERLILITPKVVRLNELPATPERVDDPSFHRSATQGDYNEKVPAPAPRRSGGCTRSVTTVDPAEPAAPGSSPAAPAKAPAESQLRSQMVPGYPAASETAVPILPIVPIGPMTDAGGRG